jgi:hypothetical protein
MGRFARPKRPMGRKLKKTLSYALRIDPKNVPANFREILFTDNGEIDVSKKWAVLGRFCGPNGPWGES